MPVSFPMAESFRDQSQNKGVKADSLLPGAGSQAGMEGPRQTGDKFAGCLCKFHPYVFGGRIQNKPTTGHYRTYGK